MTWIVRRVGHDHEDVSHAPRLTGRPPPGGPPKLPCDQLARLPALLARGAEAFGFWGDLWTCPRITAAIETPCGVRSTATHGEGITMALTAMAHAQRVVPRGDARLRIEHFFSATDADIEWARALGIGIVTQPALIWSSGDGALTQPLPPGVHGHPIGQLRAAGVPVAGSSDAPCFPLRLLWGIGAAVHRRTRSGAPLDLDQAVSVEEALRLYTTGAAWASGTEDLEGSITPGRLVNFAVLSADPTTVAPEHIHDVTVEETWVDGVPVYRRAATGT